MRYLRLDDKEGVSPFHMGRVSAHTLLLASAYAFASTIAAGTFVGFSRCGGYLWHQQFGEVHTAACFLGLVALVLRRPRPAFILRAGLPIGLLIVWYFAQVVGGVLYGQEIDWGRDCYPFTDAV